MAARGAKSAAARFNQPLPVDLATTASKSARITLYEKWQLRAAIQAVTAPTHGRKVMAGFHVMADARGMHVQPTVRRITTSELWDALRLGFEDFWAKPSHYVFLCLIYPIVGLILTQWTSGANAIQLIYPLVAVLLVIGSIPLFAGLAVVMPVLGHATWHLYRKVVEPERVQQIRRPM